MLDRDVIPLITLSLILAFLRGGIKIPHHCIWPSFSSIMGHHDIVFPITVKTDGQGGTIELLYVFNLNEKAYMWYMCVARPDAHTTHVHQLVSTFKHIAQTISVHEFSTPWYQESESDAYCWLCHHDGDGIYCELCPRMYHLRCLSIQGVQQEWVCPECEVSTTDS